MRWTILLALLPTIALAQSPRPEDFGTVTGHITCADTQRPARLAQVHVIPVKLPNDWEHERFAAEFSLVQTDLDGVYSIPKVHPGQYYLVVYFEGYMTPLLQFSDDELSSPTPEVQQRIQRELQIINVSPNSTVEANATLHRGATISGKILYDDGSPADRISVTLLRRNNKGKFDSVRGAYDSTDSHGRFNLDSVPAGDYIVEATLNLTTQDTQKRTFIDGKVGLFTSPKINFSLPIYSGNVFRPKNAAIIKVQDGEETDGVNITIPLNQFYEVTGTLLAKDGHTINSAQVIIRFADDRSEFVGVDVNNDGTFRIPYVPPGNYILSVREARDVIYAETFNGTILPARTEAATTRTYGTLELPLIVNTDIQSLILTLPDKPPVPDKSAATE